MKKFIILSLTVLSIVACNPTKSDSSRATSDTKSAEPAAATNPVEKVTITEFFDYSCGYCRNAHFTIKKLQEKYGESIEVEERHFPLSGTTFLVAETAECARSQGKFKEYHNALFEENFGLYEPENLQKVAEEVGIDLEDFNTCAANGGGKTKVQSDLDYARSIGVKSTPFFLLNDSIPVSGAIPEKSFDRLIKQILDGERN